MPGVLAGRGVGIHVAVRQMPHVSARKMHEGKDRDGDEGNGTECLYPPRRAVGPGPAWRAADVALGVGMLAQVNLLGSPL